MAGMESQITIDVQNYFCHISDTFCDQILFYRLSFDYDTYATLICAGGKSL